MQIISKRTVELTERETRAKGMFDGLLTSGWNTQQAVTRVKELHQGLDPAFFRWLAGQPLMPEGDVIPGYQESLQVFRNLLEQENLDEGLAGEYVRGGVELLADLFGIKGTFHAERIDQVLADLRKLSAT